MRMNLEYDNGILTVYLIGNLNYKTTYKIYNYLIKILEKHQITIIIFNFNKLESISRDGIDALIKSINTIHKYKGQVYFDKVNKQIYLKLKGLHIKNIKEE